MNYRVFIRNWYKEVSVPIYKGSTTYTKHLLPRIGRKTTYCYASTYEEAQQICQQYNATHNPGKLSRKAEFEKY